MRRWVVPWLELAGWLGLAVLVLSRRQYVSLWWQLCAIWAGLAGLAVLSHCCGFSHVLLLPAALLVSLGWIFLHRLRPEWAAQQFVGFLVGAATYCVGLFGGWASTRTKYIFGLGAAVLLALTWVFGVAVGGAKAWLAVGPLRFQPVEFARVLLVLFIVRYLSDNQALLRQKRGLEAAAYWGPLLLLVGSVFLLLAVQRDLGPALLVFAVYCVLSVAVLSSWKLAALYVLLAVVGFGAVQHIFPHLGTRLTAWLNPWQYAETAGYQIVQGLFALNSGRVLGKGIGAGSGELIPEVHTDFIFALIGEELGLAGAVAVVSLYLILAFAGLRLAAGSTEPVEQYTAVGIVLLWFMQVFLVVGGILRLVPLTGMTLPFLSYGSSSLAAQMWMLGILSSVGRVRSK